MVAGVPGAGIGGLYYILLAFLMPFREAGRLCMRKSDPGRWINVAWQTANAAGILGSIYATGWLLIHLIHRVGALGGPHGAMMAEQACRTVSRTSACWGLTILGCVVLFVQALRIFVPRSQKKATPPVEEAVKE